MIYRPTTAILLGALSIEGFSTRSRISVTLFPKAFPGVIIPYEDTSRLSTSIMASIFPEV